VIIEQSTLKGENYGLFSHQNSHKGRNNGLKKHSTQLPSERLYKANKNKEVLAKKNEAENRRHGGSLATEKLLSDSDANSQSEKRLKMPSVSKNPTALSKKYSVANMQKSDGRKQKGNAKLRGRIMSGDANNFEITNSGDKKYGSLNGLHSYQNATNFKLPDHLNVKKTYFAAYFEKTKPVCYLPKVNSHSPKIKNSKVLLIFR
jgi:hypothetical protein